MKVLVSDTSVLIDLDRGSLVETAFRLPFKFNVPDLLYEREIKDHYGSSFIGLGLRARPRQGKRMDAAFRRPRLTQAGRGRTSLLPWSPVVA